MGFPVIKWPKAGIMAAVFDPYTQTMPWINMVKNIAPTNFSDGIYRWNATGDAVNIAVGVSIGNSQFFSGTNPIGQTAAIAGPSFVRIRQGVYWLRWNGNVQFRINGSGSGFSVQGDIGGDAHSEHRYQFTLTAPDPAQPTVFGNSLEFGFSMDAAPANASHFDSLCCLHNDDESDYWSNRTEGFQQNYLNCYGKNVGAIRLVKLQAVEFRCVNGSGDSTLPGGRALTIADYPVGTERFQISFADQVNVRMVMSFADCGKLLRVTQAKAAHFCWAMNTAPGTVQAAMTIVRGYVPDIDIYNEEGNEVWNNAVYPDYAWLVKQYANNTNPSLVTPVVGKYIAYDEADGHALFDGSQGAYAVLAQLTCDHYRETLAAGYPAAQVVMLWPTQDGFPVGTGHMAGLWYRDTYDGVRLGEKPLTTGARVHVARAPYMFPDKVASVPVLNDPYMVTADHIMRPQWLVVSNAQNWSFTNIRLSFQAYADYIAAGRTALQTFLDANFPGQGIATVCYEQGFDCFVQNWTYIAADPHRNTFWYTGNPTDNTFDFTLTGDNASPAGPTYDSSLVLTAGDILMCMTPLGLAKRDGTVLQVSDTLQKLLCFKFFPGHTDRIYVYTSRADRDNTSIDAKGNYIVPGGVGICGFSNFTKLYNWSMRLQAFHESEEGMNLRWYVFLNHNRNRDIYFNVFQEAGCLGENNRFNCCESQYKTGSTDHHPELLSPSQKLHRMLTYTGRS